MRHGALGKKYFAAWPARHPSVAKAHRIERRAVREILRTIETEDLEDVVFPAQVGGWWDEMAQVADNRVRLP